MSKRSEEAALKAYPDYPTMDGGYVTQSKARRRYMAGYEQAEKDTREIIASCRMKNWREGYDDGYKQAEQELALTIEDIELLHTFLYAVKNNKHGCFTFTRLSDEQYEEVLRRFRETKSK